jgi:integrase
MPRAAKTKLFEYQETSVNGKTGFMIQGRTTGKRERYYFGTEKEAKKAAADRNRQLAAFGSQTALPDTERVMAAECIKMLAPFGKTLYDATHYYREYLEKTNTSKTVSELCKIVREEFVFRLANEGATLRHKRTMDSELKKFEARFGDYLIKTLTGNEIKEWLASLPLAAKTRTKTFGYIRNAYGIAVEKCLLTENPLAQIKNFARNKKSEAPPFPLTPKEGQRLLNAAEPSVLPFIAVGMFAGLRTSERDEVDWKDIHLDVAEPYIDLSAKISKTGRRRIVPVQPALMTFLAPFVKKQGRIIPLTCNGHVAYQNAWERSVKAAGLWPWSEGRLRDSFISYRYEATGSAEITAKEAGHSVQVMFDKYQKIVTKEAAERFWAIVPSGAVV